MTMKPWFSLAAIAATALILTSCGTPAADPDGEAADAPQSLEELVTAAEAEGQLVWYNAGSALVERVQTGFEDTYDITVTVVQAPATDLNTRFAAEADSNSSIADVVSSTPCSFIDDQITAGNLRAVTEADVLNFGEFPTDFLRGDHASPAFYVVSWGMGYNTDRVSSDELPTDWEDLADPKWKGRLIVADPQASQPQLDLWNQVADESGIELLEAIGANTVSRASSVTPAVEALAAGEGDLMVPLPPGPLEAAAANGAPLEALQLDRTVGVEICAAMSETVKNVNAARLFMHYLLSSEANQEVINTLPGELSPFSGGDLPSQYMAPSTVTDERVAEIVEALGF